MYKQIKYAPIFADPCTENDVQLNGDLVQVCHDSQWGFVCDHMHSWGSRSAQVVCRQVEMEYRGQIVN